jgi:hypothetical protein
MQIEVVIERFRMVVNGHIAQFTITIAWLMRWLVWNTGSTEANNSYFIVTIALKVLQFVITVDLQAENMCLGRLYYH